MNDSTPSRPTGAHRPPPLPARLLVSLGVTALVAVFFAWGSGKRPGYITDFDQVWSAARVLVDGGDPYAEVRAPQPDDPTLPPPMAFYYPLTAAVLATPLSTLDLEVARIIWVAAGAFGFTFLLLARHGYARLPAVMSGAFLMAVSLAQWSPFLACAVMAPAFGWVIAGKPNVGLAALAGAAAPIRAAAVAAIVVVIAFLLRPGWFGEWRSAVATGEHFVPYVMRPGGALLLMALLRWRRPEARWLTALACVPATPGVSESVVLFAFAMSFRECLVLALLTHLPNFAMLQGRFSSFAEYSDSAAAFTLLFVYLPALVVVLRRPNEGDVPELAERLTARWPRWLRGQQP